MRTHNCKSNGKIAGWKVVAGIIGALLLPAVAAFGQATVNLSAGPATATMPDGATVPMWGYSCSAPASGGASCAKANPNAPSWSPVIITVPTGQDLTINLTNNLSFNGNNIPTSIMIMGQLGGGLGGTPTRTPSPLHDNLGTTWFIANAGGINTPPAQGDRVQSFGTEVKVGDPATALTWSKPRAGTYLLGSGTHPGIQVPMGLYGMVVVTNAPVLDPTTHQVTTPGTAYPNITYSADVPLILGEIDPTQNKAVDAAVRTTGFLESATYGPNTGGPVASIAITNGGSGYPIDPSLAPGVHFSGGGGNGATGVAVVDNDPTSSTYKQVISVNITNGGTYTTAPTIVIDPPPGVTPSASNTATALTALQLNASLNQCKGANANPVAACYPPVVNYNPLYFLFNGVAFDRTNPSASMFPNPGITNLTGNVLVRFANAGSRMHVPSIIGAQTSNGASGFSLIAEDGNRLPGLPRVQSEVFLAAGKTYDVAMNVPTVSASLPVYDRELSLSGGAVNRDSGMLAYISVTSGATAAGTPAAAAAVANADIYNAVIAGRTVTVSDPAKGVLANDLNVYGAQLITPPATGTLTLNLDGTFVYMAPPGSNPTSAVTFTYCGNGATTGSTCATVTLGPAALESNTGISVVNDSYTSTIASKISISSPGVLLNDSDGAGYPLTVDTTSITGIIGGIAACNATATNLPCVAVDASGAFTAYVATPGQYSFSYKAKNSQGTTSAAAATVTLTFPNPTNLSVKVVDGNDLKSPITDYRWIIEEDRTFFIDPTKTTNTGGIVPTLGTNFHTSYMPVIATGCTGTLSCESGQTLLGKPAVCDIGNGVCRTDLSQQTPLDPKQVYLDPNKRYYISILPGDAANYIQQGSGHGMGGAPISAGQTSVTVAAQPTPFRTSTLTVFVFEDDFPLNGEQDAGGGVDILAPNEPGLGGFQITLWDDAGGPGDPTGQMNNDMFNMPLSNSLSGTIDPATGKDACPISPNARTGNDGNASPTGITSMIVTCPKYEAGGMILSPLAGQAVVTNLMPGRYGVVATPAADRIARGEEWLQTNTLDGQKAHDSFLRVKEPGYFQEYGPAGYHVAIGFANPKIINGRLAGVCAGTDINITGTNCGNSVTGKVTTVRMSRTPDERLYSSGSRDSFSFTQCYVSLGDPDGEDFAFTKCAPDGTFTLSGLPDGDWRITIFDQWNDQLVDGLSTPARLGGGKTTNMGDIAVNQWQANIYTKTFLDLNGDGVAQDNEPGIALVPTNIRFRDGSYSNFNNTDLGGNAGFNEVFPLFNWYVIETDDTRYKNTGAHVVYDAGGPADGSASCGQTGYPACGAAKGFNFLARTKEDNPVPANLRIPGARYCANADCPPGDFAGGSTGRVDPPMPHPYGNTYGWQGFSGQNSFIEFGKAAFAPGENGGIHGHVVYASTRPYDDPRLLQQMSWEPQVPNVTINLYQKGTAPDGTDSLILVDTTKTSSFDDWAQGYRSTGVPNMNCPGQSTSDLFYFSLYNQPMYIDSYKNNGVQSHPMPNNAQFKCYDGMHNWNQLQPAPFDGMYRFPSVTAIDPSTGKPSATNCTICVNNPSNDGTKMLPAGSYVVEVIVPPGYELVKEEDKNILTGDNFIAPVSVQFPGLGGSIYILPDQAAVASSYNGYNGQNSTTDLGSTTFPRSEADTGKTETFWPCVGQARVVPDYISLFPGSQLVAPFAGAVRNLCDRKEVLLTDQSAALARFYIFTSTHVAAHFTGVITDDFTSEFDPFSPQFGEKFAPPDLPISIKDFTGNEVSRVYSDHWGAYTGLTYSTWDVNPPNPTGYAPQMMVVCMNDPGNGPKPDPLFNPGYSQFCYEIPFMPGQTQYMDTPVTPTSAFSEGYNHPDCNYPDGTPAISQVNGDGIGPWVLNASAGAPIATLTLATKGSGYTALPTSIDILGAAGSGSGATAAATLGLNLVTISSGGSYSSVPNVAFTPVPAAPGVAAVGTAVMRVNTIALASPGTDYTPGNTLTLGGGGGTGATALVSSLKVVSVSFTGSMNCMTGVPTVNFSLGGLPAATATVTKDASNNITGITVNTGGVYVLTVPTASLNVTGHACTGTVALKTHMGINTLTLTAGGTGYTGLPTTLTGGAGTGATLSATGTTLRVNSVTVNTAGSGYTAPPTVTFSGGGATTANQARGTANMLVATLTLTNPGTGYVAPITVNLNGGYSGIGSTRATATATVSPSVAHQLVITSLGDVPVPNYGYSGPSATLAPFNLKTVTRDYGFGGTTGTVTIGGVPATVVNWNDGSITVNVPNGVPNCGINTRSGAGGLTGTSPYSTGFKQQGQAQAQCGELVITRGDNGKQTVDSVTVTIGGSQPKVVQPGQTIQSAIDAANPGDMIMVPPGVYNEFLVMWKPVRLQGVGATSSVINANTHPAGKLDPWRAQVQCLFGLATNGQPYTNGQGTNPFDPSGGSSCPGTGWNGFTGGPNNPQVDRIPLEGILGWDTTVNGNLAQLLQEPTLMGAYEGAGITVLAKGVNVPAGATNIFGSGAESTFPTGSTVLTAANCGTSPTNNPYASNFHCNPSSIDGLSITNSSQGGGGIFVHGWAHNLQISNNRVYNNSGTLTGGITIGQGETPDAYLAGTTADSDPGSCQNSNTTNLQLPYCFNLDVNIHHNAVTLNSSIGDELYSSTPAGGGGVTLCTGADYYKFRYNWVCGNLSTGDGGGLVHLGFTWNGEISQNSILFNQSTNPTVPTNGGGLMVMGAPPDGMLLGVECGNTAADADCVAGLSDGTGPNLLINANLIMGNAASSGSGGGIRFQGVNGTEVANFPRTSGNSGGWRNWNSVTVTNNIITNNVAGWDGGGVSLQDALRVDLINNTIAHNDSTATAGVLFNTLGAPIASSPSPTTPNSKGSASLPQAAGLVVTGNSPPLLTSFTLAGGQITCPPGHYNSASASGGTCTQISYPLMVNNVFWQNRSYYIGVGGLSAAYQQNIVQLYNADGSTVQSQTQTGGCPTANSYWDLGVRGDLGVTNHNSGFVLNPSYSILTSAAGYPGTGNQSADPSFVAQYCNGSRIPPEAGKSQSWQVPPGISDATVPNPIFSLLPTATVDEGNNWINVSWGPLSLTHTITGATLGNYAPSVATSPVVNKGTTTALPDGVAIPTTDFYNASRANGNDIGAVEYAAAPTAPGPTLIEIDPNNGNQATTVPVTLIGTNLTGATAVTVSGTGVTVSNVAVLNSTTVTAVFTIAANAATGARTIAVTTPAGTSTDVVNFTVNPAPPPTLTSVDPNVGLLGTSVQVYLTGTYLDGATGITITGNGVTVAPNTLTVVNSNTVTATFVIGVNATGVHNVSITTPGGVTATLPFTVTAPPAPTLALITPPTGATDESVQVVIVGTNFTTSGTTVTVTDNASHSIAVNTMTVQDSGTILATLKIGDTTTNPLGAYNVNVSTAGGGTASLANAFTVVAQPQPTLISISPNAGVPGSTVPVTITGTDFTNSGTRLTGLANGVTLAANSLVVLNSTTLTATFNIASNATLGDLPILVSTPGGGSSDPTMPLTFTVSAVPPPALTSINPISSLKPKVGAPNDPLLVPVTLTGTGLTAATGVNILQNGAPDAKVTLVPGSFSVVNDTTAQATFSVPSSAPIGPRSVNVTYGTNSTSNSVEYDIGPYLASISPAFASRNTTPAVTLTGAQLTQSTGVTVTKTSGGTNGIAVSGFTMLSDTQVTAVFTIANTPTNVNGVYSVVVNTASGDTNSVPFIVGPALVSISPNSGVKGRTVPVTLIGGNLTGATTVSVSGTGVTASTPVVVSDTTITTNLTIAAGATVGTRTITVTTPSGTTNGVTFTVVVPTISSITPNQSNGILAPTGIPVTITGTNLDGATAVSVAGTGNNQITVSNFTAVNPTTVTATLTVPALAATSSQNGINPHAVTVTAMGGVITNSVNFLVTPPPAPVLTSVSPTSGARGTNPTITLTGSHLTGTTSINQLAGQGITVGAFTVVNDTTITVPLTISGSANLTTRNISVTTTPSSSSNNLTFTVTGPSLTSITPSSGVQGTTVPVTITGVGFTGTSTSNGVTLNGSGVTVNNIVVASDTQITANFVIASNASTTNSNPRTVTVTTPGGPLTGTFQVIPLPTLLNMTPASGVQGNANLAITQINGTNLAGATLNVSNGITVINNGTSSGSFGQITGAILNLLNATPGVATVSVTTAVGTSNTVNFTVTPPPPTLTAAAPNPVGRGTGVTLTLTGTNLATASAVTVSGNGNSCTISSGTPPTATTVTATCTLAASGTKRNVTVTTLGNQTATLNNYLTVN